MDLGPISTHLAQHFRHFNSATTIDAAMAYRKHVGDGHKMLVAFGGALSTAEIGISLAEMIRQGKVHAISCSANNGEEDIFNLIAKGLYKRIPHYRDLTPQDEHDLLANHYNRVTDTCIPEEEAFRRIQKHIYKLWKAANDAGLSRLPYEYLYELVLSGVLAEHYADNGGDGGLLENSWVYAAAKAGIPLFMGGYADSTLGNIFTSYCYTGEFRTTTIADDFCQMIALAKWYPEAAGEHGVGFFQLGGGIAGDFPICVVPMLHQDLEIKTPAWSYFCQVTDTNESYGSYSGANPTEKITWGKLSIKTPKFSINSDATIVAPLIFSIVLGL